MAKRYLLTPEAKRRYSDTKRRKKSHQRMLAIKDLGGCCKRCGESDPIVLEIDHIDGHAPGRRAKGGGNGYSTKLHRRILAGNHENLQVLCANCHVRKTRVNGDHLVVSPNYQPPLFDEMLDVLDVAVELGDGV